jgi:hypothetical protein
MLNFDVHLHVNLGSGRVRQATNYPECEPPSTVPSCEPAEQATPPAPAAPPPAGSFDLDRVDGGEDNRLVKRGADGSVREVRALGRGDFVPIAASPSGRWLAIGGNEEDGDYIHLQLFLLDRRSGRIWPVREKNVRPLSPQTVKQLGKTPVESEDIVGETALWWLPGRDVLVVGRALATPGAGLVRLPGAIAR